MLQTCPAGGDVLNWRVQEMGASRRSRRSHYAAAFRTETEQKLRKAGLTIARRSSFAPVLYIRVAVLGQGSEKARGGKDFDYGVYTIEVDLIETATLDRASYRAWVNSWTASIAGIAVSGAGREVDAEPVRIGIRHLVQEFVDQWLADSQEQGPDS
jgi:hypothetical protein